MAGWAEGGEVIGHSEASGIAGRDGYAERLFLRLGASTVESLDASGFEGATIAHDLNLPIPESLRDRYSLVFDGGSIEHIFNVPRVLENYMNLVREGGHLVIVTPGNNWFGHGLYQFSPDIFYITLTPQNGFELRLMLLRHLRPGARWRRVANPASAGGRIGLSSPWTSQLFVLARRVAMVEPFRSIPQQSDYVAAWADTDGSQARCGTLGSSLPPRAQRTMSSAKLLLSSLKGNMSDPSHFERFDLTSFGR